MTTTNLTPALSDARKILTICRSARDLFDRNNLIGFSFPEMAGTLNAYHKAHPMDLDAMMDDKHFVDAMHDVYGLCMHFDRVTGIMRNGFSPRLSLKETP